MPSLKLRFLWGIPMVAIALLTQVPGRAESPAAIATQPPQSKSMLLSQSPRTATWVQRGDRIVVNGRTIAAAWGQWRTGSATRTGISDAGLMQGVGIELLNTQDASKQPVQWFSQPTVNPLVLPTRLADGFRYLDITDFAQQASWKVQVNGSTLQISSPFAKVLAVRQGKQPWGDRWVLELDSPVTWQVDQQSQEWILTLNASVDPALLQTFKPRPNSPVQTFKLEPAANQTRLRLGIPASLRPRVWSATNPNRLIIDIRADSLVERDILWAPGLRWRSQILSLGADRFPVVWLEINPRQPGLSLKPILPNPVNLAGIAVLTETARRSQAAATVNAGFFNRNNQLPLGAIRQDGRWISGPILGRGAIAWNATGEIKIARLELQEGITTATGQRLPLTHLNSAYIQAGIARYTSDWGFAYTPFTDGEIIVTVQNNRVVNQQTMGTAGNGSIPIPADGYLLVLRSNKASATSLTVNTTLRLESTVLPAEFSRYPQILAAGPFLLQNRQIVLDAAAEKFSKAFALEMASRSAIAQTTNGNLIIVAVHNRLQGEGASLNEMAQIMQQLGAVDALNLDGGSSTTLYLGGQVLDRLPRTAARVHNGIGIFVPSTP